MEVHLGAFLFQQRWRNVRAHLFEYPPPSSLDLFVHGIRRQIEVAGPDNESFRAVHFPEHGGIVQRFEYAMKMGRFEEYFSR
jgi:hypothetical protein